LSVAIKILLRYDDLARCLWDPDYCDVFHTHVQMNILLLVDTTIEGASPSHARQE